MARKRDDYIGDPPIESALFHYREKFGLINEKGRYFYKDLYKIMAYLKIFSENFETFILHSIEYTDRLISHRQGWFRESLMSCIELGIGMTPENALKLLSDRAYFESLLPIPIDSDEWGGASGTEIIRQWWLVASDDYRAYHLITFSKQVSNFDPIAFKKALACHPNSGNRGWNKNSSISSNDWSRGLLRQSQLN